MAPIPLPFPPSSIPTAAFRNAGPDAPSPAPEVAVDVEEEVSERLTDPWRVILYNDDIHTFEEVTFQVGKATGCSASQAEGYVWQAHTEGKAAVFEGAFEDCLQVQSILQEIALVTEIEG